MTTSRKITAALLALGATLALVPALASGERSVDYPELAGPYLIGSELDGANVVPGPGSASGAATLGIDTYISQRRICYQIKTDALNAVTGAYIHKGERGAAGPVRIALFEETEGRAEAGYNEGCVEDVKKRLLKRLVKRKHDRSARSGDDDLSWADSTWYAEIRTEEFPVGAVRGQLGAGMPCATCVAQPASSR